MLGNRIRIALKRTLRILVFCFILPATVLAAPPSIDQAFDLLHDGQRQEALKAFEAIIASKPIDPSPALFAAALIDLEDGKWIDARPFAKQLVKARPASMQAWEVLIQVDQMANDIPSRNAAIRSLYSAWRSALDPAIQSRVSFVRDRIIGYKHVLLGQETLDPGGDEILRFLFRPLDDGDNPRHLLMVRSDPDTNQRWRDTGTVPYGTVVYHLDSVERLPNGRQVIRPYEFYLQEPDYDRVREKVIAILKGEVQPLSGDADPFWTTGSEAP